MNQFFWLLAAFTVIFSPLQTVSCKDFPGIGIHELQLENGMVVVLKKTDFEPDEILVKLMATGGYGSLPENQLASGRFAHKISWESGLGELSADEVCSLMYDQSIEMSTKTLPFSRMIQGVSGKDGLDVLFTLIHQQFTQQRFTQEGFDITMSRLKDKIKAGNYDSCNTFDDLHKQFNSCGHYPCVDKNIDKLKNVNFEAASKFAYDSFSDPSEFTCVIVGDFEEEQMRLLTQKHLASIPSSSQPSRFKNFSPPLFPQGSLSNRVSLSNRSDSITRLTFPVHFHLKEDKVPLLEVACKIIEKRIARSITNRLSEKVQINVSFEMPYFPSSHVSWVNIQIFGSSSNSASASQLALQELNRLLGKGPTDSELKEVKEEYMQDEPYWLFENEYWLMALTNYYLSEWNPNELLVRDINGLTNQEMTAFLKGLISTDNYTQMTATAQ